MQGILDLRPQLPPPPPPQQQPLPPPPPQHQQHPPPQQQPYPQQPHPQQQEQQQQQQPQQHDQSPPQFQLLPPPAHFSPFPNFDIAKRTLDDFAKSQGYNIVINRSCKKDGMPVRYYLCCDCSGHNPPLPDGVVRQRNRPSRRMGCPFDVVLSYSRKVHIWTMKIRNGTHNHGPSLRQFKPRKPPTPEHVIATLTAQRDRFGEVAGHFKQLAEQVRANEPDTLVYYAIECKGAGELVVIEKYRTKAALKLHSQTEYLKAFFETVSPLLAVPPVVKTGSHFAGFEERSPNELARGEHGTVEPPFFL
ncbi:hypothetical protein AJ80_01651 [Polytolypa hystricis UAMH7299]|uniref:ABM domain-containing protein n=1 Tax=Polytolypa hystricis (strain UAMH7299) TaxID=1447883 RepID=A0A2B7YZE3_POLH7|nr:hypothetical protein AJ80_01651 [Polytolypa hystricis UAMH7299]